MLITIYSNKGGVGKTTLVRELGLYFERLGKKTLLVDMDNKNTLTSTFKLEHINFIEDKLLSAINQGKYIDFITSGLKEFNPIILEDLKTFDFYEYTIIDTDKRYIKTSFDISDLIIIPVVADEYNILSLDNFLTSVADYKDKCRILINRVDELSETDEVIEKISKIARENDFKILNTMIRDDETIRRVQFKNRELRSFDAVSDAAEDFLYLAEELENLKLE
ncbi:MAG: ParA family protein [Peptoniphilaceae bacterium]